MPEVGVSTIMDAEILGNGVYTLAEAGRLTGVSFRRVRAWFRGEGNEGRALIRSDYDETAPSTGLISFLDLIDTLVVGRLRGAGVSLQHLHRVHAELLKELEVDHPFCRRDLLTDGKRIFLHVADVLGEERLRELLTKQYAFPRVLLPVLKRIDYDPTSLLARRWNVGQGVIIDPGRQRGKPIVESAGIPTGVLAAAFVANGGDPTVVADWYAVTPEEVRTAVAFETLLDRSAA